MEFKAIADIQRIAIESATAVVAFAQQNFGEHLDYSDASIEIVERMLESAHAAYRNGQLAAEEVQKQAQFIGSYIGETYRRNHGADWGLVTSDGAKAVGLQSKSDSKPAGLFWPIARVEKRILNGGEDNVLHYYQFLVRRHGIPI